jgi:acetyltransferase-like isoleucine patch superfamily enzyme
MSPTLLQEALETVALMGSDPAAALRRIRDVAGLLRARLVFRGCECGARVRAGAWIRVVAEGTIRLGDRSFFLDGMLPSELVCHAGGTLQIGEDTGFNYGASVEAYSQISIGTRCLIASMVRICGRSREKTAPIAIGDNVWIAHGAVIGPGVLIGDGSAVSAGSVVTSDVPPGMLALGNPARCVKLSLVRAATSR